MQVRTLLPVLCLISGLNASIAFGAPKAITVTPAGASVIKKAVLSHKGHVVVVNFWATWCGPCVEEFPAIVRLQSRYQKNGLVVIGVSADDLKDITPKVKPFLTKQHAYFTHFLLRSTDPDEFIAAFDPTWQGDFPRTLIYDKQGHLVKSLSNAQTDASLSAAIKPFLK